jgi:chromosomal replication initiator protein
MQETYHGVWQEIASGIKLHLGAEAFQRWFAAIELVQADEIGLTFRVPNIIYQFFIESNYLNVVQAAVISVLGGRPRQIKFRATESGSTGAAVDGPADRPTEQLASVPQDPDSEAAINHGMNPRNKFAAFVVGSNNQLAHAAALAVSQSPGKSYNLLFIYGGVGLGKTHLMQAIGQQTIEGGKTQKVMYLSSERFINEFIDAIQHNTLVRFRKRYRQTDVLLIDDIHFLAGKERSQEEFFHTFDTLSDGRKQIVLSSDRPAGEIANLEQRLVSRFEGGLTTELHPPDVETRRAILRKKAETFQIDLSEEILAFLAQRVRTNVRRLEGALIRVGAYQSLSRRECSRERLELLLRDILREEAKKTVSIDEIQKKVTEHFDLRLADMTSERRIAQISFPRQVAMYLARHMTKASLHEIGEKFGGRDHGTVLHACKSIAGRVKKEDQVRQTILRLETQLGR